MSYLGILMGWAALAPIMFTRIMDVLVPLVPKLGSLLEVIKAGKKGRYVAFFPDLS